ncbi:MAG TPA: putative baseplate assembly protein [Kineosporiaceae bacterium]|nr:putative baseplate assembly protein [Kineosporiaceae bacterium]
MPLPAPTLDDRSFQDFVDQAKRAIPRHCPEWTNHNLNDPGVALIELFAWMSEQLIFRLNQVPDRLYLHFLNLVGIEPFPPGVAGCDLTFWLSEALAHQVRVPVGSQVATAGGSGPAVVFTTIDDLTMTPPRLTHLFTTVAGDPDNACDLTEALRSGIPQPCFRSEPATPGDALNLGFEDSLAGAAVRLTVAAKAEGIGIDPSNPPLTWRAWTGQEWHPLTVHRDTSGGLNRDGEVVLLMPRTHGSGTFAGQRAYWVQAVLREPEPGWPEYRRAPHLTALTVDVVGGTVAAEHAERLPGEVIGRSDGQPGQTFRTARWPTPARRPGEHVVVTGTDGVHSWTEVEDFAASGPDDRHVVWVSTTGEIRFGPAIRQADGQVRRYGAVPPEGAQISVTAYRVGGGAAGNVGARTLVALRSPLPYVATVTNRLPATGGSAPETLEEVKIRGPQSLRTGRRAVTAADYERLTLESSPRIARARCVPPDAPGLPVRMLIVPRLPPLRGRRDLDDLALDADLVDIVTAVLEPRRVVGTRVEQSTPYFQGVSVAAVIRTDAGRNVAVVRQAAEIAVTAWLDPLDGGPQGTGWPFDRDLTGAAVAHLLEGLDGVAAVEEVQLYEYDLRLGERIGEGREVLALQPDSLFLSAAPTLVTR